MSPRPVIMVIYPDIQWLDVFGPLEVFAAAQDAAGGPAYSVGIAAVRPGPVTGSSGLVVEASLGLDALRAPDAPAIDTLLVAGGLGARRASRDPALVRAVAALATRVRRIGSVCTGAFVLGAAGLLDGRRTATHWMAADDLAARHPKAQVDPDALYVRDGQVVTSAGVTAGIDLALALVEEDLGFDAAMAIARRFVLFLRRPGGQSQFSGPLRAQMAGEGPIADLVQWLLGHLDADLSIEALAARAAMSPRHFQRRFKAEMGEAPARFVEDARLAAARRLLETSDLSIERVARRTGFASAETLRRALGRRLGATPRAYRARFTALSTHGDQA